MHVLVLESEPGLADEVVSEFTASGHTVARCHDEEHPPFPCHGMEGGKGCPLDNSTVQVAVAVGAPGDRTEAPTPGEDGAKCALRRVIPLVVAGSATSPLGPWASQAVAQADPGAVVAAAEDVATAPLQRQSAAALQALRAVMALHDIDAEHAAAAVRREGDELVVRLEPGSGELDIRIREVISIRVLAALREVDPFTPSINVTVE